MRIKLGIPLTLDQIAGAVHGELISKENIIITHITTDSREAYGDDLFIPIKGRTYNGADYIPDVIKKGCFAISPLPNLGHIFLSDYSSVLLDLASFYIKNLPYILYRIGITGSVGKTTTKEFLKILLSSEYKTHANEGNYNNEIGLPMSILSASRDTQILLMEMGMNHRGEIGRMSKCLKPNIGIITNIGSAHIGNLGSREAIAEAKLEIKEGMTNGKLYIPYEEKLLYNQKNATVISIKSKEADFHLGSDKNEITIYKASAKCFKADFNLTENHHKECLLFATAVAIDIGIPYDKLKFRISQISRENTRQRMILAEKYVFYTDFYNASYESVLSSIEGLKSQNLANPKSLLLGDILELGNMSEQIHLELGRKILREDFDNLFLFGNFAKLTARGAKENGFPEENIHINEHLSHPEISADQIRKYCNPGEIILMKGSRAIRLERILDLFMK